jgi:hypothetical protein
MISSLKERFGDKLHETARKGYLTMLDVIPCKYYKLYLWYWSDSCCYGIRECTEEDFNIKEEKEMTKEEALKKIEELKEYVEKCEKKEKEIPRMHRGVLQKAQPTIVCPWMKNEGLPLWWKDVTGWMTFNEDDTFLTWGILAYELAQLMYAREYLKVDGEKLLRARKHGDMVFKVIFVINEGRYETVNVFGSQVLNENDRIWCFTNEDDANRVQNYMNKYVAHVKKNMF